MKIMLLPAPRLDKGRKRTFNTMTEDEQEHEEISSTRHINLLQVLHEMQGIQFLNNDFIIY